MANKKGQEMSVATLVLIVIGIVILVLLILGFSMGWQNLWSKVNVLSGDDIKTVTTACQLSVNSNDNIAYCNEFKKVTLEGMVQYINCEDSRIILENKLPCDVTKAVDAECLKLAGQNTDLIKTRVNNNLCTCANAGGEFIAPDACKDPKVQLKVNVPTTEQGKVCCKK